MKEENRPSYYYDTYAQPKTHRTKGNMPRFTYSLPPNDPWSPNNMILHIMPPTSIVVGDHGNVPEVGLGDASVDSTIGLSSVVSRSNHHRAVNTRHPRPMSGYMPTLGENPSLSSSSSSGFDVRRDHEHHQKRQSSNAPSSSVFGGGAMHPHIQELVERQRQKKRGGEASSSPPGTCNRSRPRRQDRQDDVRHRPQDHTERRENPFVSEENSNPHVIRGLINSYRDDFVSISSSTYNDPHRPKLQQPPLSPLTLRTKLTREQQQIEQQHVVNDVDDEDYVMMMEIKGQGCACQAADDVAYLFGCGTRPEDEMVSLFVQKKTDSNSENGGDKRQEYMNPNAMKTNQEYDTMMLSLKSKENAHRQYQHIKNGWLDPHLCGLKTRYDGSSGVKSTWSFSHLLDYVQTKGGCQLPSGGNEVLSPKSRKTRRSEKKLVMKRSDSTEDSAFHRMANVVDELKCQLKSMRSERQSEVRDNVGPTLSDSHESFDFLVPKPLDEHALHQQQQQQSVNQFQQSANHQQSANQFTVNNSTAAPFQPLSPMAANNPAFTPFGGQPVSTSPLTSFTRFTYPPRMGNTTESNYMDSPMSPNNATAMMGNTSGMMNGMGHSSTYTMSSSLPGYPMTHPQPTSFQSQSTSFHPQTQLPQMAQHHTATQYQQPELQGSIPKYQQSMPSMPQQAQYFGSTTSNNYTPTTYQQYNNPPQTRKNLTPPITYTPFPIDTRSKSMPGGTSRLVFSTTRPTTNIDEYQQTNQILNELKLKNELMQQDIQRMMTNDTKRAGSLTRPLSSGVESRQQPSVSPIISAKERLAQAMQKPQPSGIQSRYPSMAPSQRTHNTQGYRS